MPDVIRSHCLLALLLQAPPPAQERSGQPEPAPPSATAIRNVVLITLDTVRADHLGCYGYFRDTTPQLDAFARECVRFTRCLAPIAQTTPSHSSLFTGVLPLEHGVLSNFFIRPAEEREQHALRTSPTLQTLAQVLRSRGFRTGGFVAATPVKKFTGLAAGFDEWTEPEEARRAGSVVIGDALQFLEKRGDAPTFTWIHLFDAHGPVKPPYPPQPYLERFRTDPALEAWLETRGFPKTVEGEHSGPMPPSHAHNLYDGALRFLDDQLGVLLQRLRQADLWDSTAVVILSDHGHGLGQHDYLSHGTCWDEQYRVPLLIRVPGVAPATIDHLCSTIDVVPTLLALVPSLADESLLAQCRGTNVLAEGFEPRPIFGMSPIEKRSTSITTTRFKLLRRRDRPPELYDLENDPFELRDVAEQHQDVVQRLSRLLADEVSRQQRSEKLHHAGATGPTGTIEASVLEELRELGYGAGDEDEEDEAPPPAPSKPSKPPTKDPSDEDPKQPDDDHSDDDDGDGR